MKVLYIVRGPFGAQKTELARSFCKNVVSCWDYYEKYGENQFNPKLKPKADEHCLVSTEVLMKSCTKQVAVVNSFSNRDDCAEYFPLAHKYGYKVYSLISDNPITEESRRNAPKEVVLEQIRKIQTNTSFSKTENYFWL